MQKQQLRLRSRLPQNAAASNRRATATVELALVMPLLVLLVMGSIEVGQLVNTSQALSNGARVGAKKATRSDVTSVSEVESSVTEYMDGLFEGSSATTQVKVFNQAGEQLADYELGEVPSGDKLTVEVTVNFDSIRWMSGFIIDDGYTLDSRAFMRRE